MSGNWLVVESRAYNLDQFVYIRATGPFSVTMTTCAGTHLLVEGDEARQLLRKLWEAGVHVGEDPATVPSVVDVVATATTGSGTPISVIRNDG